MSMDQIPPRIRSASMLRITPSAPLKRVPSSLARVPSPLPFTRLVPAFPSTHQRSPPPMPALPSPSHPSLKRVLSPSARRPTLLSRTVPNDRPLPSKFPRSFRRRENGDRMGARAGRMGARAERIVGVTEHRGNGSAYTLR